MGLTDAEPAKLYLPRPYSANSGLTRLEGNMAWTRYNHMPPPGCKSCTNGLTWNGAAMTANSRHAGGVDLLLGDGSVRFVKDAIAPEIWRALGTISAGEVIPGDY